MLTSTDLSIPLKNSTQKWMGHGAEIRFDYSRFFEYCWTSFLLVAPHNFGSLDISKNSQGFLVPSSGLTPSLQRCLHCSTSMASICPFVQHGGRLYFLAAGGWWQPKCS